MQKFVFCAMWLELTERKKMICKICVTEKEKILLKNPSSDMTFINGSVNFKSPTLKDHAVSDCHKTGIETSENGVERTVRFKETC